MEEKENLAKEKGEEKWEAENRKARTFRKAVETRSFRKIRVSIWSCNISGLGFLALAGCLPAKQVNGWTR